MAILRNRFYFGPEGKVGPLPAQVRDANSDFTATRYGATTRGITGAPSVVSYGAKQVWSLKWPPMTELESDQLRMIEAVYLGMVKRRTYFLDTRRSNALPYDVSSCGAVDGLGRWISPSGGTLARTNTGALHADLDGLIDGYLTLNGAGAGNTVRPDRWLPVIPGSSISFHGYVSGTGTVTPSIWFRNAAGIEFSVLSGSPVVLGAAVRTPMFTVLAASLPAGATSFRPGFSATTTAPTLNTSGWAVQYDDPTVYPWRPGGGGCECVVGSYPRNYYGIQRLGGQSRREFAAEILEA